MFKSLSKNVQISFQKCSNLSDRSTKSQQPTALAQSSRCLSLSKATLGVSVLRQAQRPKSSKFKNISYLYYVKFTSY